MTTYPATVARQGRTRGASLIELMVSIGILTVLMGAVFTFMSKMQQRYTTSARTATMNQMGRTAFELLAIDIGQAGFPGAVGTTTTQNISGNTSNQPVSVASTAGMFPNRVVLVDTGVNQEAVRIISATSTSITGLFKLNHANGVPIVASMYPYAQGVLYDNYYQSNGTSLGIMGDLLANGTLRFVEYSFYADPTGGPQGGCNGTLNRSDTDATASIQNPKVVVAERICNTAAQGVFSYNPLPTTLGHFVFVTDVTVTLTMETQRSIESSAGGSSKLTVIQTLSPRNVGYGLLLSKDGLQTILPVAPGTVLTTLPCGGTLNPCP